LNKAAVSFEVGDGCRIYIRDEGKANRNSADSDLLLFFALMLRLANNTKYLLGFFSAFCIVQLDLEWLLNF
jgi:hypothetical protein